MPRKSNVSPIDSEDRSLTSFEGNTVAAAGMEIPGAAGGLRDALDLDPIELHTEEEIHVVFRLSVNKVRFEPVKKSDDMRRVHVMRVEEATFVDPSLVDDLFATHRKKVEEARIVKEQSKGIYSLSFDDPEDDSAE